MEFTVEFQTVEQIGNFVSIANRQPFPVQILHGTSLLDAKSILSLCSIGLHTPLTVRFFTDKPGTDAFRAAIVPFLCEKECAH